MINKKRLTRGIFILFLGALLLLAGCGKNPEVPSQAGSGSGNKTAGSAKEAVVSGSAYNEPVQTIPIETVEINGFSMNYFKFGQGDKTFVMLPGLSVQGVMGSAEQVASAYQMMTDDYTVYVFDPRNELPSSYNVAEMAKDTAEVLKALGLDHVCMMGASMGGMTALEMAVQNPELIDKLVLASVSLQMKDEQFQTLDKWIGLAQKGDVEALYLSFGEAIYPKEIFKQARDSLIQASKTVTEDQLKHFIILAESMRGFDITNDLEKIECPILAINDKTDQVLGAESVESMEQFMNQRSDWDFYLYDGYGHALYDTAPDFKDRMMYFFKSE